MLSAHLWLPSETLFSKFYDLNYYIAALRVNSPGAVFFVQKFVKIAVENSYLM